MRSLRGVVAIAASALTAVAGCAGGSSTAPNAADRQFVADMLVHHVRALQLGALAAERGTDPRVRAFGMRILDEQTPEEHELATWSTSLALTGATGAMAAGYVTDAQLVALQSMSGPALDRQVILLSASSELGAVEMAATELAGGRAADERRLATSISGAPRGEIPELQALAAALPT